MLLKGPAYILNTLCNFLNDPLLTPIAFCYLQVLTTVLALFIQISIKILLKLTHKIYVFQPQTNSGSPPWRVIFVVDNIRSRLDN